MMTTKLEARTETISLAASIVVLNRNLHRGFDGWRIKYVEGVAFFICGPGAPVDPSTRWAMTSEGGREAALECLRRESASQA